MRKSLNFDLDTKKLKEHYLNKNYTEAYNDIKKFLIKNGFEHRQGSGYISEKEMSDGQITRLLKRMNKEYNWLRICCKTLDYYDVGSTFNGLEILEDIKKDKILEINKTKEVKQEPKLVSNYEPKNKYKSSKNKDIER